MKTFHIDELIRTFPENQKEISALVEQALPLGNEMYGADDQLQQAYPMLFSKESKRRKISGAGDAFAMVAQPIARSIDKVAGTNIANCEPCKKRREAWNKAIPFGSADKS